MSDTTLKQRLAAILTAVVSGPRYFIRVAGTFS